MSDSRGSFTCLASLAPVLALALAPLVLTAQGEKFLIRPVPAPSQTIKLKMTQATNMEMVVEEAPGGGGLPPGPMKSVGKTVFEGTQSVGQPDAEGRVSSDFTYDLATTEMTMNGKAVPIGDSLKGLQGKTIRTIFDAQGNVLDFIVPDDLTALAPRLKEMITSLVGGLPTTSLGVRETATMPITFNVPVPIPGPGPMRMVGQGTFTLLKVDREGAERIATLESKSDMTMAQSIDMPGPDGPAAMNIELKMAGSGMTRFNPDRGYVKSSDTTATIEGSMIGPLRLAIHGTIRIVIEGTSM